MSTRIFNRAGIEASVAALDFVRQNSRATIARELLEDESLTEVVGRSLSPIPSGGFASRWQLGIWLFQQLHGAFDDSLLVRSDGLWTWLAFRMFDVICPTENEIRKVGEDARYVLDRANRRRWYRHLLAGPYLLIRAHQDSPSRLRAILAGAPSAPGDMYEQLAGRKEIVTSASVVDVVGRLYWDSERDSLKRGARGDGPGSVRRFGTLIKQFDVTFDLARIDAVRLEGLLPKEFNRFRR